MAKAVAIVSALCFLAFASIAHAQVYNVEGQVYCDPCRVEFQTSLSKGLKGAVVELECRERATGKIITQVQATTDENGSYNLSVAGEHEEEICEVKAIKSTAEECNAPFDGTDRRARVLLTQNNGVQGTTRYANPLGFKTLKADEQCKGVLENLGFLPVA